MKKLAYSLTFSLLLIVSMASGALGVAIMGDYHSLPPFLTASVTPNLLLLIDNSASMYDLAYIDNQENCYDDSYVPTNTYSGYCEPGTYYKYDETDMQFEATTEALATTLLAGATGTKYVNSTTDRDVGIAVDKTVTPNVVTAFVAKGNFINWAMASKFDIEKKILTGGKLETTGTYGAPNDRLVMESRGCLDRRFIKKIAVLDADSNTLYLTLGIGGPKEETFPPWENATAYVIGDIVTDMADLYIATTSGTSSGTGVADDTGVTWVAYTLTRWTAGAWYPANSIVSDNGEMYITAGGGTTCGTCTGVADDTGITDWDDYNVTYIEIFPVTSTGFDNTGCQDAIDMLTGVTTLNLGQLKVHIDDCMGYTEGVNQGDVSNYMAAFNHAIHNCWYASKQGSWPPGAGPVQAVKPACEALYTAAPPINPWDITTDSQGYVCFGAWDVNTASPDDPPAGYVGRCWSPGAGSMICTQWKNPNACKPFVAPDPECCQKWEWSGTGTGVGCCWIC